MTISSNKKFEVLKLIKNNDKTQLKNYVKNNRISLKRINSIHFDLLIYAIEQNVSLDVLYYIMEEGNYHIYSYSFKENGIHKVPLFIALSKNNFSIAKALQEKGAGVNVKLVISSDKKYDIIYYLYDLYTMPNALNTRNLMYILNHGFKIKNIHSNCIQKMLATKDNVFLEMISYHIYKNLILKLLSLWKDRIGVSKRHLQELITKEKGQLSLTNAMYDQAFKVGNYDGVRILLEHDTSNDSDIIYYYLNKYQVLEYALTTHNSKLVQTVIPYETIDFNINFKKYIYLVTHNKNKNNSKNYNTLLPIVKLLIQSALKNFQKNGKVNIANLSNSNEQVMSQSQQYNPSYFNTILNYIIKIGDDQLVQDLIESQEFQSSVDINIQDIQGVYPIFSVLNYGSFELFKYFIEQYHADIHVKNQGQSLLSNILHTKVIGEESIKYITLLLDHQIDILAKDCKDQYPLFSAIKEYNYDAVILLMEYALKHHIDLNLVDNQGNPPLITAYQLGHDDIVNWILNNVYTIDIDQRDANGNTLLYYALLNMDESLTEYLLDQNAEVHYRNNYGKSPLSVAISKSYSMAQLVLSNLHQRFYEVDEKDIDPDLLIYVIKNPLFTIEEKKDITRQLIYRGYNINRMTTEGHPPLIDAILLKLPEIVQILIENGADVNYVVKEWDKSTLMIAIDQANLPIIQTLVENGADVNYHNSKGQTPIMKIIEEGSPLGLKLLIDFGALIYDRNTLFQINNKFNSPKNIETVQDINIILNKNIYF